MAEEQKNSMYMYTYKLIFLMKYQNQRGRHVDRQTEGPKKREKNTSNYIHMYAFPLFLQQSLIPPETQSEMDS